MEEGAFAPVVVSGEIFHELLARRSQEQCSQTCKPLEIQSGRTYDPCMAESRTEYIERLGLQLCALASRLHDARLRLEEAESRFNLHVERRGSEERRRALWAKWNEQLARYNAILEKHGNLQLKIQTLRGRGR